MNIDKKLLFKLRKQTGMGMLDCKKALETSQGDFDKALDWLAEKGKKIAIKKAGRDIEEGMIFQKIHSNGQVGVLLALGCETDFVAATERFAQLGEQIMDIALTQKPAHKEDLLNAKDAQGTSVQEHITLHIGRLGENISLPEYHLLEAPLLGTYIHTGGKLGAIVALNQEGTTPELQQVAKDLALHIVATNPLSIDEKHMDPELLAKEKSLIQEQLQADNKPQEIKDRIATGKMKKFLNEHTLLAQPFIKEESLTCQAHLAKIHPDLAVLDYRRIHIDT